MTTAKSAQTFRFPDPPEREPDDMTSFDHLARTGSVHHLMHHLGHPETTIVTGEHYLARTPPGRSLSGVRYPDLLIAFDVDPEAHRLSNAYVISEQGKPPDFVLEIASSKTAEVDTGDKRREYAGLGIPEYWRFDETGEFHGTRLAGDRLVDGAYRPIPIEQLPGGVLQGYSYVLNLHLRWEDGQLRWHDPATGRHIATFEGERDRAELEGQARIRAEGDARMERSARVRAEDDARVEREARLREREARLQAEARARELEERLENLENQ